MKVENIELLKKIIDIQACLIQGRGLRAILRFNQQYLLDFVDAKIITICVLESEKMYMEHILEKDKNFERIIKKHIIEKTDFKCNFIIKNFEKCLTKNKTLHISENFYDIYKNALSKKDADELKVKVSMEEFAIMPIYDMQYKNKIAFLTFIFDEKNKYKIEKIEELRSFFEALLQPMYDSDENILFPRCVRIDKYFHPLSTKEKIIIKKVMKGESYINISEDLDVSINTIKTHMKNIFNKYAVHSKIELYNKITSKIF